MSDNNQTSQGSIGFFGLLAILFIGLKLGGVIGWSWIAVTAPLWAPAILFIVAFTAVVLFLLTQKLLS